MYEKDGTANQQKKYGIFNEWYWTTLSSHLEKIKNKAGSLKFQMDQRFKIKNKTLKVRRNMDIFLDS